MYIQLYDTTLRDGSQGEGVNFSIQDKLLITKMLDDLGFDFIEGGFAGSNEKDTEYFQQVRKLDLKHATVCSFGMTRRRGIGPAQDTGLRALLATQTAACTVVGKTWDLHVTDVLRVGLDENLAMIADSVGYLASQGRRVIYDAEHFFDGYAANPEYAAQTVRAAQDAGAEIIVACDTNGGTLPDRLVETVRSVMQDLTIPIGIHCHNDCDVGVANSLAAIGAGAVQVQGTVNGIGERCGNADLVSIAANLALKTECHVLNGDGVARLTELSRYVYELANMNFRPNQAFVGRSAFAHKGGMHVHAVNRIAESYEHIPPEMVGNERRILVSELSGRSNIIAKTTKHKLDKDPALLKAILDRVVDLENEGYQFEASEASFDLLVKKCAGTYQPKFERIHYRVNVETAGQAEPLTEATVKLRIPHGGEVPSESNSGRSTEGGGDGEKGTLVRHEVAEGDGPVNALDTALRKALLDTHPNLESMHLADYKVRVINSAEGTAARVRVVIESKDAHDVWSTVGVSENIIEASWLALVDAVEYKLFKDDGQIAGSGD